MGGRDHELPSRGLRDGTGAYLGQQGGSGIQPWGSARKEEGLMQEWSDLLYMHCERTSKAETGLTATIA